MITLTGRPTDDEYFNFGYVHFAVIASKSSQYLLHM